MRYRGISNLLLQTIGVIGALPSQGEQLRREHDLTERFMTSAGDMRPEATLLISMG
jgi:hypothetical protein